MRGGRLRWRCPPPNGLAERGDVEVAPGGTAPPRSLGTEGLCRMPLLLLLSHLKFRNSGTEQRCLSHALPFLFPLSGVTELWQWRTVGYTPPWLDITRDGDVERNPGPSQWSKHRRDRHGQERNVQHPARWYHCNALGHIKRNFPMRESEPLRCFHCDAIGHIKRDCPTWPQPHGRHSVHRQEWVSDTDRRGHASPPPWSPPRTWNEGSREMTPLPTGDDEVHTLLSGRKRTPSPTRKAKKQKPRKGKKARHLSPAAMQRKTNQGAFPVPLPAGSVVNIFHAQVHTVHSATNSQTPPIPDAFRQAKRRRQASRRRASPVSRCRGASAEESLSSSDDTSAVSSRTRSSSYDSSSSTSRSLSPQRSNHPGGRDPRKVLLTAGDVEANPGPMVPLPSPYHDGFLGSKWDLSSHAGGRDRRAQLLCCGDVEANPGPAKFSPMGSQRNMCDLWNQHNAAPPMAPTQEGLTNQPPPVGEHQSPSPKRARVGGEAGALFVPC